MNFQDALKEVYSTQAGKLVLDELKAEWAIPTAMATSPEGTAFLLGRKELILELFELITSPSEETTGTENDECQIQ